MKTFLLAVIMGAVFGALGIGWFSAFLLTLSVLIVRGIIKGDFK